MQLLTTLTTPFGRKIRLVLLERAIDCEIVIDVPTAEDSRVPHVNPLGKVPVLLLEDGQSLFDSPVIAEYLDMLPAAGGRLLPADRHLRLAVRQWESAADGISDAAAAIFMEKLRPSHLQSEVWMARQYGKIARGLAYLSAQLGERSYCVANQFSLADIAVGCALGYLDLRFAAMDWRTDYANLAQLSLRLHSRPAFQQTIAP
jgi:glutathione S-transferase